MKRGQSGATLIEVLVAILVFSFGLLGTVAMQARAARVSVDSEDRMRAAMLANEIVAAMWSQRSLALPAGVTDAWKLRIADTATAGLPDGDGSITATVAGGVNMALIKITWSSSLQGRASYVTQIAM